MTGSIVTTGRDPRKLLAGGGELGARVREFDWSRTQLGAIEAWPTSLLHHVAMILELPSPAIIFWGPELTQIYNEGYALIMGPRHPKYFGATYRECWPDTYPLIYPWMRKVLDRGEVVTVDKTQISVTRHGFVEEAFFTFSFSPLRDDDGVITGIYQPVVEVTSDVLSERRASTLRCLEPKADSNDPLEDAANALATNPHDIPFAIIFLWNEDKKRLDVPAHSEQLKGASLSAVAEVATRAFNASASEMIERVDQALGDIHLGPWPETAQRAIALPMGSARGVVVLGISPRLRLDDKYRDFLQVTAGQIGRALASHRLQAEQQQEREHLYALFAQAPLPICVLRGNELVFEMANARYLEVTGRDDLVGKTLFDGLPEARGQGFDELLRRVMTTGEPYVGKEVLVRLDRDNDGVLEDTYFTFVYSPFRGRQGTVDRVIAAVYDVTDQVVARRAVEQSEDQLRRIVTQVEAGIAQVDLTGRFVLVNDRYCEIVGRAETELRQLRMQDITHPDDLPGNVASFQRLLDDGEPIVIEKRYLRVDGSMVWVQNSIARIQDRDGRPQGVVSVTIDITQRKQVERALKDSEERYRELAQHEAKARREAENLYRVVHDVAEVGLDLETMVQRLTDHATTLTGAAFGAFFYNVVNESGEAYLLYALSGAPRAAFDKLGLPRNTAIFAPTFSGACVVRLDDVKSDPRYGGMAPHHGMPKGHLPVTSYLAVPVVARSGEVLGGLFFGHPERARFGEQEERMAVLIANHAARVIETARLYELTKVSEAAQRRRAAQSAFAADVGSALTEGGALKEVLDRCCELAVQHLGAAFARVWTVDEQGTTLQLQASAGLYTHIDGPHGQVPVGKFKIGRVAQERKPHLTNDVLHDELVSDRVWAQREGMVAFAGYPLVVGDQLVGVFAMFAKKQLAEDTLDVLATVADTIAIGIERLRNEERRVMLVEELRRTLRDNETFAGILGHDLRNPLAAMMAAASLLEHRFQGGGDEKILKPVSRILTSGNRMARMIDQLLDFTRIRVGSGIDLRPSKSDFLDVSRAAIGELQTIHSKRRIQVAHTGHFDGSWDGDRLQQVISNLVANALQHSPPETDVRVRLDGTRDDTVELCVENQGSVPPELLPHLFDAFRGTRKGQGLGLGLFITKQVVTAHGGAVHAESSPESGTKLIVNLPRLTSTARESPRSS